MIDQILKLLIDFEDRLKFIDLEEDDPIKCAQLFIDVCLKALTKLKNSIFKHKFKTQTKEIRFFKEVKPKFLSLLIYNLKVFKIESHKPNGCNKIRRKYLLNELDKIKHYFDRHLCQNHQGAVFL